MQMPDMSAFRRAAILLFKDFIGQKTRWERQKALPVNCNTVRLKSGTMARAKTLEVWRIIV